jgi:hypothetical protein
MFLDAGEWKMFDWPILESKKNQTFQSVQKILDRKS